ncbi:MAG: LysR family transcriptional regulator [Akkermansiaceae bacterium]|nr:LysR family transcriptional regulator [Akkermansiaceae bacterium]
MPFLNYHHLRYFRFIAREENLMRAAKKLNLSPPALSLQLKQLEDNLGHALFERLPNGLKLTEAGRTALQYAEDIARSGEELLDVMAHRPHGDLQILRCGAVGTLSRNFLLEFLRPALHMPEIETVIRSGSLRDLLVDLHNHEIDVLLSNIPAHGDAGRPWHSHLLAQQPVSLVGTPKWKQRKLKFPKDFRDVPMILPSLESNTRASFDRIVATANARPLILAEVDDMAMLRLLAREGEGLALVPSVVVRDEIESGTLVETHRIAEIEETFYAITPERRFPNPITGQLVERMTNIKADKTLKAPRKRAKKK